MIPWPVLATVACLVWSIIDKPSDIILNFGGVTLLLLLPLGAFNAPEWIFGLLIIFVWLLVLVSPVLFLSNRKSYVRPSIVVGLQLVFSLSQAALGFLMLLAKGV